MTQREIIEPTVNARGDEEHPAFGQIRAARVTASHGQTLFDSDIQHRNTVRISLESASRKRDLNHDRIHGDKHLVEVEMSEAQWASFVSSMNTSGVPCTIRALPGDWFIPGLPYDPRLGHSMAEVKGAAVAAFGKIREARDEYEQALKDKAPAKVRNEALRKLHYAIENSGANMTFAAKTLAEHTENVVQKARADIEAMVAHEATRLGLEAGQAKGLLELPALAGEVIEAEPVDTVAVEVGPADDLTVECAGGNHDGCSGYTEPESDPELCNCPCHEEQARAYAAQ